MMRPSLFECGDEQLVVNAVQEDKDKGDWGTDVRWQAGVRRGSVGKGGSGGGGVAVGWQRGRTRFGEEHECDSRQGALGQWEQSRRID